MEFYGYDHVDCRVRSLEAVETFYDDLMPEIGLTEKRYAFVDPDGEWHREFDELQCDRIFRTAASRPNRAAFSA